MRAPPARGNVQKVKRNLFGSPTKEDQEAFKRTYEESMAKDREVLLHYNLFSLPKDRKSTNRP